MDPDQVRQVLLNLLRNALAAAGKGGRVRTCFEPRGRPGPDPRLGLGGSIAPPTCRASSSRSSPSARAAPAWGCPRSHSIVRAHGGQIQVSSSPGEGTEFVVGFAAPAREVGDACKILVVDDEPAMREYLEVLLARSGYEVLTAPRRGRRPARCSARGQVDLVISDMKLGKDSGLEVLKHARAPASRPRRSSSSPPTARPPRRWRRCAQGAYDYICKPFDNEELKLLVQKALEKRTLRQENQQLWRSLSEHSLSMVGRSAAMESVRALVREGGGRAAPRC